MTRRKKLELEGRIQRSSRRRKIAIYGIIIGAILIAVGQLTYFPALFIIGYTTFIICTGIASFLTAFIWLSSKGLKTELKHESSPPPVYLCPRCGATMEKKAKFCPKCGKKASRKG